MGQMEEAQTALAEAFDWFEGSDERVWEPELCRVQGELRLDQGDEGGAQRSFEKAIEAAQGQCARSWELCAAISLARLWQKQDRRDEAQQLLAPIYG